MIEIDGSEGEGGGQILRTALALSAVTGRAFRIDRIRARRAKPGLAAQHLTCVQAAAAVCGARVDGAGLGSTTLTFSPSDVIHKDRTFSVGTVGATALVAQTVIPPLLVVAGRSRLVFEGGTHGKMAPSSDFLARTFVPALRRMGARVDVEVERRGFYPAGGGRVVVVVEGVDEAHPALPFELLERGPILRATATALVQRLPRHIGEREVAVVKRGIAPLLRDARDQGDGHDIEVGTEVLELSGPGPGNAVLLELESAHITEVITGTGERKKTSEAVAGDVVDEARRYLLADVPVGEHLADQLLLPMALLGGGSFRTLPLTEHTRTNIVTLQRFVDVAVNVISADDGSVRVTVRR